MEEELSPTFQTVHSSTGSSASSAPYVPHSNSLQTNYAQNIGNVLPVVCPGRALINPFDPSHVTVKMTSNLRRWTHVFPKGTFIFRLLLKIFYYFANFNHLRTDWNSNSTSSLPIW